MPRVAPTPSSASTSPPTRRPSVSPSRQRRPSLLHQPRSSRSSDPRRLSGAYSRRSSGEWFQHFDPRTALDPNSPFLTAWHQVLLLALVFECFLLPYAVVFDDAVSSPSSASSLPALLTRTEFVVFYAVETLFLVDFYVKLNTGFYEDGNVFRDASRARVKYLTSLGFALDLVAIVPLALLVSPAAQRELGATPVWFECHKVLRLWRVPEYFATLEDLYAKFFVTLKMIKVVVVAAYVPHVLTCARVSFGVRSGGGNDSAAPGERWLPTPLASSSSSSSVYLRAFFWTFGLLTGVFEGELPREADEFVFTIAVLLAGFSLFSYLCAVFIVLSKSEQTAQGNAAEARLHQLKHVLCYYRVPEALQFQAVEYVKRFHTEAEANDREVAKLLCPSIAKDIQVELLSGTVARIPLFKGCSSQFVVALTSLLEMVALPADYQLFATGDPGDCMYVVNLGVLHILVNGAKVRDLRKGSFFGEVSVFSKRPRSATVVTASYCTLYKLSRFHIERVLEGYPQYAESIALAVDAIINRHGPPSSAAVNTSTADNAAAGPSRDEFMLTTLFQLSGDSGSSASGAKQRRPSAAPKAPLPVRQQRPLQHKRSWGAPKETPKESGVLIKKAAAAPKRPAIGRSKSAQNVSIARREQLSLRSRRSEREKTDGGDSEAATTGGDGNSADRDDKRDDEHQDAFEIDRSPTYVPRPTLLKRSQSFFARDSRQQDARQSTPLERSGAHRGSGAVDAMQNFYDNLSRLLIHKRERRNASTQWLARFLLRKPIRFASRFRLAWVAAQYAVLLFHWFAVPLLLGFEQLRAGTSQSWGLRTIHTCVDLLLWADVYVTANLEVVVFAEDDQERLLDATQAAHRYLTSRAFVADVLSALPYSLFVSPASPVVAALLRLPRLARVWRAKAYGEELWRTHDAASSSSYASSASPSSFADSSFSSEPPPPAVVSPTEGWTRVHRIAALGLELLVALHCVACAYFGLTQLEGFSPDDASSDVAWLPTRAFAPTAQQQSGDAAAALVGRQYTRALFFAATTLTTLGKTLEPQSSVQFVFTIACMVLGLLLSAFLVDVIHTRFTAATLEQKEFLVTRARIQSFLRSQNAPPEIMQRVNAFLDFWWSAHRGAIASELLTELPESIRREVVRAMCAPAVQTLALLADVRPVLTQLEQVFVDGVDFILYGQGEIIYRQGDYASGLFFLLDGEVCMITDGSAPRSIPKGGFFGTAALHLSESSVSYAERMTAISGCILLFVPREHLHAMHRTFPTLSMALKALERRIIDSKFARAHALDSRRGSVSGSSSARGILGVSAYRRAHFPRARRALKALFQLDDESDAILFDPDTPSSVVWQLFVAALVVVQSCKVIFEASFGVAPRRVLLSESLTVLCELCFGVDMFFRSRLGFYEYGNKIMDMAQMRRRYVRSSAFALDAVALVPLFLPNWALGHGRRVELLGLNKLVRLARVTHTLTAMEAQYLNRTFELRLLKIVYYTLLPAHALGCVWFSFGVGPADSSEASWLADARLRDASGTLQYLSAVFWSFGVMTASTTSAIPETPLQSLFAVATMLAGLTVFAYIVGNLTDVVELRGADTREFNTQLASLRHLLKHFDLPEGLQDKLKTYVFFQRFHSITQEHILEGCLPPSLLTDIRLVHLQPMIVKVAFLAGMDSSVTRMLVSQFLQVLIVKDQFVCRYGEHGSDMFFVFTGVVEVLVPAASLHRLSSESAARPPGATASSSSSSLADMGGSSLAGQPLTALHASSSSSRLLLATMKKVNELTAGSYFGEIALFTNKPRTANTLARTSCVLYKLSRRSLELVFERYPEWKKRVLKIVSIQQEQQHLRNLYMAEQQHDENRLQQMRESQAQQHATTDKDMPTQPLSPRRLGERLAQSSTRLVRRMSSKRGVLDAGEAAPPPPPPPPSPGGTTAASLPARLARSFTADRVAPTPPASVSTKSLPAPSSPPRPGLSRPPSLSRGKPSPPPLPASASTELWIDKLLACTQVQSPTHVLWLHATTVATLFMAVAVPYRVAFDAPLYTDETGALVQLVLPRVSRALEHVCELLFAWDIWMNWNMKESLSSMELYETRHRAAYQKQRRLLWDALAVFPVDHFVADFYESPWLRLNRCLKVLNFQHYVDEIYRRSVRYEQTRFVSRWLLFLLAMYWCACAYFVVVRQTTPTSTTSPATTDWYQWAPPAAIVHDDLGVSSASPVRQLATRILRSFFFAATVFVKKGKTFVPESESQLLFTLIVSFVGLLTMAIMIGEVTNLYVSYISNEVDFRHHHTAVKKYLERWRVSARLRARAQSFLSSLWSSHRGVNYQAILDDIPPEIRHDVVLHVGSAALEGFVSKCFSPFLPSSLSSRCELEAVMLAIAQQLKYEGFPRDESVVVEGSIAKEMYFVVKGVLVSRYSAESTITAALAATAPLATHRGHGLDDSASTLPREVRLHAGDCFGDRGLLGYAVSRVAVKTLRACDLLALTSEALLDVLLSRPLFQTALGIAVESYKEMAHQLRQQCDLLDADALDAAALLGLSSADEPWGDILLGVIEKRQRKWQEQWQVGGIPAAQYNLLGPIRELKQPEACRTMFDSMLRLILPHGSLFARVASVRNKRRAAPNDTDGHSDAAAAARGDPMASATDFHDNLPLMMSAASLHSERVGWSFFSTVSSSGSREMSSTRRTQSRSRMNTPSLAAKMLPPEK